MDKRINNSIGNPIKELPSYSGGIIKALFSDIDGTIRRLDNIVSNETIDAIAMLAEHNIKLILATGRTFYETKDIAATINQNSDYFITQHGAVIVDKDENVIFSHNINYISAINLIKYFYALREEHNLQTKVFVYTDLHVLSDEEFSLPLNWEPIHKVDLLEYLDKKSNLTKILFYDENIPALKFLESYFNGFDDHLQYNFSLEFYFEAFNKKVSKGNAIEWLSNRININLVNAACIGDGLNDLEMMITLNKYNGITIAMGNSNRKLFGVSSYITDSIANEGFKTAIESVINYNCRQF